MVKREPSCELEKELTLIANNGYKEIVLVGINLACYGQDLGIRLIDAIKLADKIEGIERIRLGSFEPEMLLEEDIKELALIEKFCPHFHISLQSGCDETLKRMNRHYNSQEYYDIVRLIRKYFDSSAITTDVITGFPGETQQEFEKSIDFVKKVGFAKVHVFPYSRRKGTVADKMPMQIDNATKSQRAKIMQTAANLSEKAFLESFIGKTVKVLCETYADGYLTGFTANYTPVKIKTENSDSSLQNTFIYAKIKRIDKDCCIGELI